MTQRVNIAAILADPVLRKQLLVSVIQAIQLREGIHTTQEQAEHAYEAARREAEASEHPLQRVIRQAEASIAARREGEVWPKDPSGLPSAVAAPAAVMNWPESAATPPAADAQKDRLIERLKKYEELGPLGCLAIHPETPGYTTGTVLSDTRAAIDRIEADARRISLHEEELTRWIGRNDAARKRVAELEAALTTIRAQTGTASIRGVIDTALNGADNG